MKRLTVAAVLAAVAFGPFGSVLRADISPEQVRQAIAKGVQYLKRQQRKDNGAWLEFPGYPGGVPSLCTLALLNSGAGPDEPAVRRALIHLRKSRLEHTYCVALQTMVFCQAEPKKDLLLISRNVKWLQSRQVKTGPMKGVWSYPGRGSSGDNSNSQFALLALHEAERVGVKVDEKTWRLANAYWESCQNQDGSWGYRKDVRGGSGSGRGTGSMTCAGIASLVITSDKVRQSNAKATGERIFCCVQSEDDNRKIEQGLEWLGRRFSVTHNPGFGRAQLNWSYYYLYGVERVGRLTARRFIGGHDWYREGVQRLLADQDGMSGFWKGVGHDEGNPLIGTSLALLFLSKGRRPVLMAKLEHDPGNDWNEHRSDVDNLTRYVESRWGFDMTWQAVDVRAATVEDLLQAPVLYLCGKSDPAPKDPTRRKQLVGKLRDYLDRGGFLFAEAYRNQTGFDRGFRQLIKEVFPEPEYRLRVLEGEHPIWYTEEKVEAKYQRQLWGIDFGCRTSVVYAAPWPKDNPQPSLSCLWELSRSGRGRQFAPPVKAQIDAALSIGLNVLAYATNRELEGKEKHFRTLSDPAAGGPVDRGRLYVAKLRHPGGCNSAPRALATLMETAAGKLKIRATAREELIRLTDDVLFDHHLVFMHGRNAFRLTDAERRQLKTFLERGGMLFADAICASSPFDESFRREMRQIFPQGKLQPIPVDDPLLTSTYGGYDLKTVQRRDPQKRSEDGPLRAVKRTVEPELEGIKLDGRWGVVYSRYDVSCALEKHDTQECRGYLRQDAARIGLNAILYSLQQ